MKCVLETSAVLTTLALAIYGVIS